MPFGHEKLDVYRLSLEYVVWVFELSKRLTGDYRHTKDQLLRASQSIPLNIAEGNGKFSERDRGRFFEIARGSALECAAVQDVLEVSGVLEASENAKSKEILDRVVAMLTRLGKRGYAVGEETAEYEVAGVDTDADTDTDTD